MQYSLICPVLFGNGVVAEVGAKAKEMGLKKVLVVTDPFIATTEGYQKCVNGIKEAEIELIEYKDCLPDPPASSVEAGAAFAAQYQPDGVIAIGSGSAMDTAKGIALLLTNPGPFANLFYNFGCTPPLPVIAVTTSSGTGSENSIWCVITDEASGKKLAAPSGVRLAVVDPELTLTAPPHLTAHSAMDAASHACEAYAQIGVSPFNDVMALDALKRIVEFLPKAMKEPYNLEYRNELSIASNFAGIAMVNGGTHFGHGVAHIVGGAYHIPHGLMCALGLPAFVKYSATYLPERTKEIGKIFGATFPDGATAEEIGEIAKAAVKAYVTSLGLKTFADYAVTKEGMMSKADEIMVDPQWYPTPNKLSKEKLEEYLAEVFDTFA